MKGWILAVISVASVAALAFGLYSYIHKEGTEKVVLEGYNRFIPEDVRGGIVRKKRDE
jgi:hypothetical protein